MKVKLAEIAKQRGVALDKFKALAEKSTLTADEQTQYDALDVEIKGFDEQKARLEKAQAHAASTAQPVADQDDAPGQIVKTGPDAYEKDKSLIIGGVAKMLGAGGGNVFNARTASKELYGENHPVTKALSTSSGSAGGFIVPPGLYGEIIPLLRAKAVVRSAGPRNIPMPRGTMTLPGQGSAASAKYGAENKAIGNSQQTLNQIVASYKKLTALVPVSNDMMRYADPAVDAFVRDDLVQVIALTEDQAFILSDGTQDTPRGYLSFANGWVGKNSGTVGVWLTTAASTFAVNGADPANSTGGNFITSTANYTLATVSAELGGAINRLDTANVPEDKRVWFMHPRSYNYLFNVQNSLGIYVFRDELVKGTLLGYPFKKTTQIGNNYWDASATNKDLSFVFLVEMTEDMILDSMQLQLAVSTDGSYVDSLTGATISAFQNDQTLIRAIAEHDHQMRHQASVAVIQGVRWAPAIS